MQNIPHKCLKLFFISFLLLTMLFGLDELAPWHVIVAAVPFVLVVIAFAVYEHQRTQRLEQEYRERVRQAIEDLARTPESYRVSPEVPARPPADLVDHVLTLVLVGLVLYRLLILDGLLSR